MPGAKRPAKPKTAKKARRARPRLPPGAKARAREELKEVMHKIDLAQKSAGSVGLGLSDQMPKDWKQGKKLWEQYKAFKGPHTGRVRALQKRLARLEAEKRRLEKLING